jgi:REP element-mobilizing transposase RayT
MGGCAAWVSAWRYSPITSLPIPLLLLGGARHPPWVLRVFAVGRSIGRMSDDVPKKPSVYHGFGGRLLHEVPAWVRDDAIFHIRVRIEPTSPRLTEPSLAAALLDSVKFYHARGRWWVHLFVLMPDHWHALLTFGAQLSMGRVIGEWKKYHARHRGIVWQEGFFDHRLRNHLAELDDKHAYIRRNPVASGLCVRGEDWPWQWSANEIAPDTRPENPSRW